MRFGRVISKSHCGSSVGDYSPTRLRVWRNGRRGGFPNCFSREESRGSNPLARTNFVTAPVEVTVRGKKADMERKQRLIQQRDQLLIEIEALRNKVIGLEMAIALFDGHGEAPTPTPSKKRSAMKDTVLDLLNEVGTTGLKGLIAVEIAERRSIHLDRQSVSSLLSRLKADGAVLYEGQRYKLKQFAGSAPSELPLRVVKG